MKNWILFIGIFFLLAQHGIGQSEWEVLTSISEIEEAEIYDNRLYAANAGGLLVVDLETRQERLFNSQEGLIGATFEIERTDDNILWVLSDERRTLSKFDGSTFEEIDLSAIEDLGTIRNIIAIKNRLWFIAHKYIPGENQRHLYSLENGQLINQSTNIPQNISRITKDINDNLWIAATDYIYKYDQVLSFTRMIEGLTELQTVSDIHVDSEDNIWLTIADEFRFGGEHILGHVDNSWSSYMAEVYLIDQLYEDENGAIKFRDVRRYYLCR